jgi:hypothetical protein
MAILSFAYTTPPLLALIKRVTRRQWSERFAGRVREGDLVKAYDRAPYYGGKHVADIQIQVKPYLEPIARMPDEDYVLEGFQFLYEHPDLRPRTIFGKPVTVETFSPEWFEEWRSSGGEYWVVRFELVRLVG